MPQDRTTLWLLVAVGTLTIIYAVIRPMFRRKDPLQKPPAYASLSRQRAVEREMQNVLVELAEMARQITAQLDSRATKLELLIKDADQRIAQLKESPAPAAPSAGASADTKFCVECGHAISKSAKFCPDCGKPQPGA